VCVASLATRHVAVSEVKRLPPWVSFKLPPWDAKCPGSGTEIIPGKHPDTRIKPLPLTNGHDRYMAVTPERALASVGGWPLHLTVINL
jgi:hypothetical protein